MTGVTLLRRYPADKVGIFCFSIVESSPGSPVVFHQDRRNLTQDGETVANLQVIKPQWLPVGAPVYRV